MTYHEYDNVELEESESTCPTPIVRNCGQVWAGWFIQQVQDESAGYYAKGVAGTAHLMTHNAFLPSYQYGNQNIFPFVSLEASSIVRNGDYIYMEVSDEESNGAARKDVLEYQISTGTSTRIHIHSFTVNSSFGNTVGQLHITYLMDRKILVAFEHNHGYEGVAPNRFWRYHAHTVDFETGIVTQELEWLGDYESASGSTLPEWENMWPDFVMSVKDSSGDVWGYVMGMIQHWTFRDDDEWPYLSGGVFIYYKNFTRNTEWGMVRHDAGTRPDKSNLESWLNANPVLIGKEKIVIQNYDYPSGYNSYPYGYTGIQMFIFDIATQTITTSSRSSGLGIEMESPMVYDKASGLLFFQDYSPEDDETYCVSAYNPDTDAWTENVYAPKDPDWDYYYVALVCDKNHAYFIADADKKCYRADGIGPPVLLGTLPIDEWAIMDWHYPLVVDEYGPSFVWWDETLGNTLHQTGLDGTSIAVYSDLFTASSWDVYVFDLGGCFAIIEAPFRQPIDYYLVT